MKIIDKFLKKLNTSRNTFATYVLTLVSVYLAVDRIVEMLFMIFTGISVSYWGPIAYTLALACPIFAFLFSPSSEFGKVKNGKITLFFVCIIGLYIIAISMITQWVNALGWFFIVSLPGYVELVTDFSHLIRPAFTALALFFPLTTFFSVVKFIVLGVGDSKDMSRSIWDYKGISLSDPKSGHGPYTNDIYICKDKENGAIINMPEKRRYQSLFVCGGSGRGKTALVLEPMMARDLERKFFYNSVSKEMGYTALKTGIAVLNKPYSNDYLNENFSLNMLTPVEGREAVYKAYMNKMILSSGSEIIYRNVGLTFVSPDFEAISHMIDICKNFKIKYNLIDPSNSDSIGLNPFVYDDPNKIAVTISSVLKGMYINANPEREDAYKEDFVIQAIENLTILLKEMYPRMNEGKLPNLLDMLKMLTNFELIEKMCEILKTNEELAEKYSIQLAYFKKNFYRDGRGREDMEKYIYSAVAQLDNLLRLPGMREILCNRTNNVDFDKSLANAEVTFVCTRRGELGGTSHKAFGLFYLLSMQNSVLRRPGNENSRVPHFLYIDEFPDYICKDSEAIFTMYRKYKVGTVITAQALQQLETSYSKMNFRQVILSNCANKIFVGGGTPEDLEWWSKEFGNRREWTYSNSMDMNKLQYDSKYGSVKWAWVQILVPNKLGTLAFKNCGYKILNDAGAPQVGEGMFDFVASKYKEPQKVKFYDFSKFTPGVATTEETKETTNNKFNPKNINFEDDNNEINPIQTDITDSNFIFNNEDAIVVNFKKKGNE